jgi:hypothetical protein
MSRPREVRNCYLQPCDNTNKVTGQQEQRKMRMTTPTCRGAALALLSNTIGNWSATTGELSRKSESGLISQNSATQDRQMKVRKNKTKDVS